MSTDVSSDKKLVYRFDEGDASMGVLLGGKGSNLCEMVRLGLPVPPGFVISTEACLDYFTLDHQLPAGLLDSVRENVHLLEKSLGREFGSSSNPLLVSVRSGSRISMPGMMDTILNLGINDEVVQGLASMMGDARPAYDAYRRFLQIYADVVLEIDLGIFEEILAGHKERAGVIQDHELTADVRRTVVADFKAAIKKATGAEPPADPWQQLAAAVEAVFRSWNNARAVFYRDFHGISHDMGTAVTVQAMVFGNMGDDCATGIAFTRDPSTGENAFYGEYLVNAQGEDVVAGIRTPQHLTLRGKEAHQSRLPAMEEVMPEVFGELEDVRNTLEAHYKDMQDIEFTVQRGRLWMLQTRSGKRTAAAALKIAVDSAEEGLIGQAQREHRLGPGRARLDIGRGFVLDEGDDG